MIPAVLWVVAHFAAPHGLVARIGGDTFAHTTPFRSLGTSADGRQFYTLTHSHSDGVPASLFVWDAGTGRLVARHTLAAPPEWVSDAVLEADRVRIVLTPPGGRSGIRYAAVDIATGRVSTLKAAEEDTPADTAEWRYSASGWVVYRVGTTLHLHNALDPKRVEIVVDKVDLDAVALRPDGRAFVVVPPNSPAMLFDLPTGKLAHELPAPPGEQRLIGFTPSGGHLALWSKSAGGWALDVWDAAAKTRRTPLAKQPQHGAVVFSPCGTRFAFLPQDTGRHFARGDWEVRDYPSGTLRATIHGDPVGGGSVFSADGRAFFTRPEWRALAAWDADTGGPKFGGPPGPVAPFRFTAGGQLVGQSAGSVFTWDPRTGKELSRVKLPRPAHCNHQSVFTPDGGRLAFVDLAHILTIWDIRTGAEAKHPLVPPKEPWLPADRSSPDGRIQYSQDGDRVTIRSLATGATTTRHFPKEWKPNGGSAMNVAARAASPDGRFVALCSEGNSAPEVAKFAVTLFDLTRPEVVRTVLLKGPWARSANFSPDGRSILVVGDDIHILDAITLQTQSTARIGTKRHVTARFSPDGRTLAYSFGCHEVRVVELASGAVRAVLPSSWRNAEHSGGAIVHDDIAFSPDGRLIATPTPAGGLMVWDARNVAPAADLAPAAAWAALTGDAAGAYAAVRALASPGGVAFLKANLPPVTADAKAIAALVAALDDDEFAERERASKALERLGGAAAPELRRAVAGLSPEGRKRAAELLDRLAVSRPTTDELRAIRAVEAAEWAGTPDAVKLLEAWAGGAAGARLTAEAKAALGRR